jgi:pimeloyl-ACP methyl ester carboxylesterase
VATATDGTGTGVEPLEVPLDDVTLSGLVARPSERPRALLLALPGHHMTARYFDAPAEPSLSLLTLGADLGFTVVALDRPGYGASIGLPDERLGIHAQVELLLDAMMRLLDAESAPTCLLVGHSYGFKVALAMAASEPGPTRLLGVDGTGTGLRYSFDPGDRSGSSRLAVEGDKNPSWGPERLYPPDTFRREHLPTGEMPPVQGYPEVVEWPDELAGFAHRIAVPLRFTFGEHERLWRIDPEALDELRHLFPSSPRVEVGLLAEAGHNVSLGWSARAYHLGVLAFAEECLAALR